MSGIEWDGAPRPGESAAGREPQATAGPPTAGYQGQHAIGGPVAEIELWHPRVPAVEPHPNWYQPVQVFSERRRWRGRIVATVGAAAAVVIGAVAVAVIVSPKSSPPQATSPPKSSSPKASSSSSPHGGSSRSQHAGALLTGAGAVIMASQHSADLMSVSATFTESITGPTTTTVTGNATEQRNPLLASMKLNVSMGGTNIPISAILNSHAIYIKVNGTSLGMPASLARKWIKIPFAELGSGSGFTALLGRVHNDNPVSQAQLLQAPLHLRAAGTVHVDGAATTKYKGWFKPLIAVKYVPSASLRAALAPALKLIKGKVRFIVWIDAQNRIKKLVEVEHVLSSTVTNTYRFFGFNKLVHITLPPASEVVSPAINELPGGATIG